MKERTPEEYPPYDITKEESALFTAALIMVFLLIATFFLGGLFPQNIVMPAPY